MRHLVHQLNQWSLWAEVNPGKCPCGGGGWLLSDFDTFHRCGLHGVGVPHPESEEEGSQDPHRMLRLRREAYRTFMTRSGLGTQEFLTACVDQMGGPAHSPQEWVDAAEAVTGELLRAGAEKEARAQGYSCDLERRLTHEAELERRERRGF